MQSAPAKVIPLERIGSDPVGGKAAQLAQLHGLGLRIPEGFVVLGATPGNLPAELDEYSARLGGAVAVRSSALGRTAPRPRSQGSSRRSWGWRAPPPFARR